MKVSDYIANILGSEVEIIQTASTLASLWDGLLLDYKLISTALVAVTELDRVNLVGGGDTKVILHKYLETSEGRLFDSKWNYKQISSTLYPYASQLGTLKLKLRLPHLKKSDATLLVMDSPQFFDNEPRPYIYKLAAIPIKDSPHNKVLVRQDILVDHVKSLNQDIPRVEVKGKVPTYKPLKLSREQESDILKYLPISHPNFLEEYINTTLPILKELDPVSVVNSANEEKRIKPTTVNLTNKKTIFAENENPSYNQLGRGTTKLTIGLIPGTEIPALKALAQGDGEKCFLQLAIEGDEDMLQILAPEQATTHKEEYFNPPYMRLYVKTIAEHLGITLAQLREYLAELRPEIPDQHWSVIEIPSTFKRNLRTEEVINLGNDLTSVLEYFYNTGVPISYRNLKLSFTK